MPNNSGASCKPLVLSDPARKVRFRVKKGSYERVHDWVRFRRDCEDAKQATKAVTDISTALDPTVNPLTTTHLEVKKARSFMPCQLVWLLMLTDEKLCDEDRLILRRLSDRCLDIPKARVLALKFQRLMFEKDVQVLSAWFTAVKSSLLTHFLRLCTRRIILHCLS